MKQPIKYLTSIKYKGRTAFVIAIYDYTCLCVWFRDGPQFSVLNSEAFPENVK